MVDLGHRWYPLVEPGLLYVSVIPAPVAPHFHLAPDAVMALTESCHQGGHEPGFQFS